ncbi:Retrotrans gag domain-containing protein [Abeliophyllum distichum]|uniref:Retrotrans gag domain-containing protein n=1 Tax=Abeliophyllum distichum TaxID=126358 RepID=A0ABD1Q658_9LAMI
MDVKSNDERSIRSCDLDDDNEYLKFSKDLKARELFTDFKMPHMKKYSGHDNFTDHINMYKMRLQCYILAVKCKNFHTILVSDVKKWYKKLKPGSIKSWSQLK